MVFALYFKYKAPNMTFPKAILWLLAVFFGILSFPINAQVNLKTGYSISLNSDEAVDNIIAEFNQSNANGTKFKNLRWMHGFDAGLRYKSGISAFELSYLGAYRHLKEYYPNPAGGSNLADKLKFDVHSAGFSYQLSDGYFGAGAELEYQWYVTKAQLTQPDRKFKDVQEMWATKLYLMLILEGSGDVTLIIEPYYIIPHGTYDSQPLQEYLETTSNPSQNKWTRLGISFMFYNGRQE
jgi:hypothetical protein